MTGSIVSSNHPVYITSGAVQSSVNVFNFTSNLVSYVLPAERNGYDYIFVGVNNRTTDSILILIGKIR